MRELEAKFELRMSREEVAEKLAAASISLTRPAHQIDYVYASSPEELLHPQEGTIVARIRFAGSTSTMTVKQRRRSDLDRSERELVIDDGEAGRDILQLLGLQQIVVVEKFRQDVKLNSSTSLLVDEVLGLGAFLELEVLDDTDQAQPELEAAIEIVEAVLGSDLMRVDKGYDRLLVEAGRARESTQ